MNQKTARDFVYARSAGEPFGYRVCEIRLLGVCTGQATDWHHRKNRSQGGLWTPSNGLDLCHACHMTITNTRAIYFELGWLVSREDDPASKRAYIHSTQYFSGQWVPLLLKEDGDVELAGEPVAPYVLAGAA